MKKYKGKIQMGIVIGIFSVIIIACLISIFSRLYAENKEKEEFRQLAEIVTEETTDATINETVRKPNLLKVSDCDNYVENESPVYYTTCFQPHSVSDLLSTYKDFTDAQLDTIEILLMKLYARFGITDTTDYSTKKPTDFPVMSDFYDFLR